VALAESVRLGQASNRVSDGHPVRIEQPSIGRS
jgi:hypothetical protein